MTQGSDFRDEVIGALRRDLMGPLVDPDGSYPGAEPKQIDITLGVGEEKELRGLLVHDDGEELLPYVPTSRYGVGILFPQLRPENEESLDREQDEVLKEAESEGEPSNPPSAIENLGREVLEPPEDPVVSRSPRPSAMGFSFVLAETSHIEISLKGAHYEPIVVSVHASGNERVLWHRVPVVEAPLSFHLSSRSGPLPSQTVVVGPVHLEVGCVVRRAGPNADQIITCYVRNVTVQPGSSAELKYYPAAGCLFQVELTVQVPPGTLLEYPNALGGPRDEEDRSLSLLYANHPIRAIGHGCDAVVRENEVRSQTLPVAEVPATSTDTVDSGGDLISVGMKALGDWDGQAIDAVEHLIASYDAWIALQESEIPRIGSHHNDAARDHIARCSAFLSDIREGWELAKTNDEVRQCLRWASHAMADQQRSYRAMTRQVVKQNDELVIDPPTRDSGDEPKWRGFQIAFVLASIPPAVDLSHVRRHTMDVIWMPTGGGKTEAYLGLAAFTILWRRVNCSNENRGLSDVGDTTVLMRYTLRLLTAQQLQRTASLMCALEVLRMDKENQGRLGTRRFSVGAWLGSASTPNTHDGPHGAVKKLKDYIRKHQGDRPFLLNACPWCACRFVDDSYNVFGYSVQHLGGRTRMQAKCPDSFCPFSKPSGLPVYEVDEDLYKRPPTFIVGTVDKFAMLAWQDRPRAFFGINTDGRRNPDCPGPDLIIQDELHLITGPLGSLVGLYESGIKALCLHDGGHQPRIVAATATTRAYERQTEQVFGSKFVRLLPPPGLVIEDSFFAHADDSLPPRMHVGVCATGLGQFTRSQARVIASLSHAVGALLALDPNSSEAADYYWTNLVFFGSLRDLGTAKSMVSTDIGAYLWNMVRDTGVKSALVKDGKQSFTRFLTPIELTSASSQSSSEALSKLGRYRGQDGCADLALATSVIEVGVDVPRLGLLTIVRQPKTAATYIQVSGRVGRRPADGPGLIVVLLSPLASRDISHYERFTAFHSRLYEAVEPATVTPFTDAALERGIRGVVSSVVHQTRPAGDDTITQADIEIARTAVETIASRAEDLVGQDAAMRVRTQWSVASNEMSEAVNQNLPWGKVNDHGRQFLRIASDTSVEDEDSSKWPVLTSLRNVDATGGTRIHEDWVHVPPVAPTRVPLAARQAQTGDGEVEADW